VTNLKILNLKYTQITEFNNNQFSDLLGSEHLYISNIKLLLLLAPALSMGLIVSLL